MAETVEVEGVLELLTSLKVVDMGLEKALREGLREGGQRVQGEVTARFRKHSQKTARGFRTYVRTRGVSVEQSLRKTTGKRSDWGGVQMAVGLLPARDARFGEVVEIVDKKVGGLLRRARLT